MQDARRVRVIHLAAVDAARVFAQHARRVGHGDRVPPERVQVDGLRPVPEHARDADGGADAPDLLDAEPRHRARNRRDLLAGGPVVGRVDDLEHRAGERGVVGDDDGDVVRRALLVADALHDARDDLRQRRQGPDLAQPIENRGSRGAVHVTYPIPSPGSPSPSW